jgi:hypothetical protein
LLHHYHPWLADGRKNIRRRIASLKDYYPYPAKNKEVDVP